MGLDLYRKKRNFGITPEPEGRMHDDARPGLSFVIQKHRASHLHYDFRLELDGVLLSWAVPKGPSLDPADKRLAMQTEDHPIEYGDFEGVIPPKQYGAGTVLLWDRGTWIPEGDAREAYRKGKLKFRLEGEKLHGGWTLVRAWGKKEDADGKSWFLIKANDDQARQGTGGPIVEEMPLSVASGRDLEEIAADPDRVWHSNRSVEENVRAGVVERTGPAPAATGKIAGARKAPMSEAMSPQLATLAKSPPVEQGWVHEIKFDGYRMLCRIEDGAVRMISRNGNDWTQQFLPITRALARLPARQAWLDGEVVVMEGDGRTSFQALQNALGAGDTKNLVIWLFDVMYLDGYDLTDVALHERKRVLKQLLEKAPAALRYSEHFDGSGMDVHAQACKLGLEGIVSKRQGAPYSSRRSKDWLKIKCALRQEMVIGGFTDPGGSRTGFGALLLGVHDAQGQLRYCGKVGTGFNEALLTSLTPRLEKLQQSAAPFVNPPRGYEAKGSHWIKPELVAEIAFTEWTRDGTVRHPSFQGLREDKAARDVVLEVPAEAPEADVAETVPAVGATAEGAPGAQGGSPSGRRKAATKPVPTKAGGAEASDSTVRAAKQAEVETSATKVTARKRSASMPASAKTSAGKTSADNVSATKTSATKAATTKAATTKAAATKAAATKAADTKGSAGNRADTTTTAADLSRAGGTTKANPSEHDNVVAAVVISNPDKVLYPEAGYTKLELARYYEAVGELMLPHLRDRPLTLVRCPNGWKHCFYQKHAKDGVAKALEQVEIRESTGLGTYMIANSVTAIVTLLQMGVLELHPWGSTRGQLDTPDRLIFDFDPDENLEWARLVEAVRLLRTLLDRLKIKGFLKTTGGKGLHVVVPVRPDHDWEVVRAFTKCIADLLVQASPERFTSKLSKARRGGKIFVDYLRNSEGATAVAAYSLRAKADAPVSLPIAWEELERDVRFSAFNVRNVPPRLERQHEDPWAGFADASHQAISKEMLAAVGVK
ncbi:MAG: non-homologous end-joining DNA ligase [Pseudomonadota bacterium]|nr:non-homologous end-joining DNA ligase [Pseudomonadota bacterium]